MRRSRQLIPDDVPAASLPDALRGLTVGEAATTYMKINRHLQNQDGRTSADEYARNQYAKLLRADRYFQTEFPGLTTAMITRRVSPRDEFGDLLTPFEVEEMLNGSALRGAIRSALDYHLDEFDFEWAAVTTPDAATGAPYELLYLWIDDPDDEVTTDHIEPALERHLDRCANALDAHHRFRADGSGGAIEIQHDPELAELETERLAEIIETDDIPARDQTAGALHLATNLPALVLADHYDPERPDPRDTLIEGAAAGWACRAVRSHKWVRYSGGVPSL